MPNPALGIIENLLNNKVINNQIAEKIKFDILNQDRPIEELLEKKYQLPEIKIIQAKAKSINVPFIDIVNRGISPEVLNFIPEPVARRYTLIPFELESKTNELAVAMKDPLDFQVIEFLEKKAGKKIKPYLAISEDIIAKISEQYTRSLTTEVTEALKETSMPTVKTVDAAKISEIIREAPIAKIVSTLLDFAVKSRASDIHVEPQEQRTRVRYRIDGILHERLALPKSVHDAVVSRIKILSDMKIDEKRTPQDGRFNFRTESEEVDLRVSTLPTVHGEKVVIRLLKKTGGIPDLPELGLRGVSLRNLEESIARPHGIILVTGPTGSGKTTTLYSVLQRLNTTKVNIVTLEDPVEYQILGVNQVQINPAAGLTFATGLRSFLRQDPNIILVGEIRDSETTNLAIQAALTGHLVFSTLHTNNAAGAIPRLLDMGAEPFLVASTLNCVVAQRICRRLCSHCKQTYTPLPEVVDDIKKVLSKLYKEQDKIILYKSKGCKECNDTGYFGRIGIFEAVPVSIAIAKLTLEHVAASDIEKRAILEGMITMKQDGYLKVLEGITTLEEVLRVAQD